MYNNPDFFKFFFILFFLFLDMHNIRGEVSLYGHLMYQSHRLRRLPGNLLLLEKMYSPIGLQVVASCQSQRVLHKNLMITLV